MIQFMALTRFPENFTGGPAPYMRVQTYWEHEPPIAIQTHRYAHILLAIAQTNMPCLPIRKVLVTLVRKAAVTLEYRIRLPVQQPLIYSLPKRHTSIVNRPGKPGGKLTRNA